MSQNNCKRFKTLAIHAGQPPDAAYGAVMTPIYQTSTFAFRGVGQPGPFDYSRSGNPTRKALEDCLAALEAGRLGFAFGTGMAAETTLLTMFEPGDHLVVHNDLYGGTYRLLATLGERRVAVDYVDLRDLDAVRAALRPSTRAIWIETPTNPCMNLVDLAAVAQLARDARAAHHLRQHLPVALLPAAARVRRRHRAALDHQVHQRPLGRGRRGHRGARSGAGRAHRVPAERAGHLRGAVRLLPGAARHQDAGAAHGGAQPQRAGDRALAGAAPEDLESASPRTCRAIRSTRWRCGR